jgi:hypothetical protein
MGDRELVLRAVGVSHGSSAAQDLMDLAARYLDLVESVLTGTIIEDQPIPTPPYKATLARLLTEMFGVTREPTAEALGYNKVAREHGLDWPSMSLTMIGGKRLHNFRFCIESAIAGNVPGDIVETGVWRGGACILARAVLEAWGVKDRRVYLADSFAGLPPPNEAAYPADRGSDLHQFSDLAVSEHQVRRNFEKFGLLDDQVVFVPGWFRDTMRHFPAAHIAVLRLDGDMYESTIDPLTHLWDRLSPQGWLIIDDYHMAPNCRQAIDDFCRDRHVTLDLQQIDGTGVFCRKG